MSSAFASDDWADLINDAEDNTAGHDTTAQLDKHKLKFSKPPIFAWDGENSPQPTRTVSAIHQPITTVISDINPISSARVSRSWDDIDNEVVIESNELTEDQFESIGEAQPTYDNADNITDVQQATTDQDTQQQNGWDDLIAEPAEIVQPKVIAAEPIVIKPIVANSKFSVDNIRAQLSSIKNLNSVNQNLQATLSQSTLDLKQRENQIEYLQQQSANERSEAKLYYDQMFEQFKRENNILVEQISSLQFNLVNAENKIQEHENVRLSFDKQNQQLDIQRGSEYKEELEKITADFNEQISNYDMQISKLQSEVTGVRDAQNILKHENQKLVETSTQSKELLLDRDAAIASLRSELKAALSLQNDDQLAPSNMQKENLQLELDIKNLEIQELGKIIDEYSRKLVDLEQDNIKSEQPCEKCKMMPQLLQQLDLAQSELQRNEQNLRAIENSLSSAKSALDMEQDKSSLLLSELSSVNKALELTKTASSKEHSIQELLFLVNDKLVISDITDEIKSIGSSLYNNLEMKLNLGQKVDKLKVEPIMSSRSISRSPVIKKMFINKPVQQPSSRYRVLLPLLAVFAILISAGLVVAQNRGMLSSALDQKHAGLG